jgi:hypothetical protein
MWLEAVMADGGQECRDLCLIADEPLVQGMLVGLPENLLSASARRNVSTFEHTVISQQTDLSSSKIEKQHISVHI